MSQREKLEAEFPEAMLSKVPKGGAKLTYIPVAEVVHRLNEVLGTGRWSWAVDNVWRDEQDSDWVLARGTLTATVDGETCSISGEGGVLVKRTRSAGEIVDLGDEFKGASSDALKKAAQRLGVGAYLARRDDARRYEAPAVVRDPLEEGWGSVDEAVGAISSLKARIKALPADQRRACSEYCERLGIIWPPSKDEHDLVVAYLASPPVAANTPPTASDAPLDPVVPAQPAVAPDAPATAAWVEASTARALAEYCREHDLPASGTKPDLMARVIASLSNPGPVEAPLPDPPAAGSPVASEMIEVLKTDVAALKGIDARAYAEYRRTQKLPSRLEELNWDQAMGLMEFLEALAAAGTGA